MLLILVYLFGLVTTYNMIIKISGINQVGSFKIKELLEEKGTYIS
jgi:hypothetical protein